MKDGRPIYYWDSSVLLDYFGGIDREAGALDGMREIAEAVTQKDAFIIMSTIIRVEVLLKELDDRIVAEFINFLEKQDHVEEAYVDFPISNLARIIRKYYLHADGKTLTVSTPDSIHLATAIIRGVDEFHTFDERNKTTLGLIPLNGNVAGHRLIIKKPLAGQLSFHGALDHGHKEEGQ